MPFVKKKKQIDNVDLSECAIIFYGDSFWVRSDGLEVLESMANFALLTTLVFYSLNHFTDSTLLDTVMIFLPCDGMTMTLATSSYSGISRVECSARCLATGNCQAFRFNDAVCRVEINGLSAETTVPATDGCFATKGNEFICAQSSSHLELKLQ